jgi:glycosyltransferase involved in cell wall biosynthesis
MADQLTYIVISCHSRGQYDTREYIKECVRTLEENTTNYRLIFVDDFCDEDGSAEIRQISKRFSSSYTIRTEKQRWFTRAFNLGLRLVRSPYVILLNTDTVLGPGWLEELYSVKAEAEATIGSHVGIVGSEFSEEEGRRWQNITSPTTEGNPGYVTAHCLLVDMQAMFECSVDRGTPGFYLDETRQDMIHIRSDNEISYRMQKLGWNTIRSFKSAVGHHGGRSWGHNLGRICGLTLSEVND